MADRALKDNVPPHNDEAEQATLGALLLDWNARSDVGVFTRLKPEHFYSLQNQVIFKAMLSLDRANVKGDTLTLVNELTKNGDLDKAGGVGYIASLTNTVPTSANIAYYADIVFDQAMRRALIKVAAELKASAFEESKTSEIILDDAERKIFDLAEQNNPTEIYDIHTVVHKTISNIEILRKNNKPYIGIPSGFSKLDDLTNGFREQQLIVIGARPGMGKTSLALSMMEYISVVNKIPCGFFSLEMSYESIGMRLISQVSRISAHKIRAGMVTMAEMQSLQDAAGTIFEAPFYIVDTPNMQLLNLRAMSRRMVANHGVKIIFIDYIGLITTEDANLQTWERVSEISRSLKSLARELNIPIVALSQLSRDAESNKPNLAQIRGSGSIEQDADVVMFIHGNRQETEEERNLPVLERELLLEKQRDGATGKIKIAFLKACTKFENLQE